MHLILVVLYYIAFAFPSPSGVWIASAEYNRLIETMFVSVPWRGIDFILDKYEKDPAKVKLPSPSGV